MKVAQTAELWVGVRAERMAESKGFLLAGVRVERKAVGLVDRKVSKGA